MNDLIDREAAIEAIRKLPNAGMHWFVSAEAVFDVLLKLPSAQPERKTGKWIDETFKPWGLVYHPYKCDQCSEHSEADSNFCPNCGADMRGEQDE